VNPKVWQLLGRAQEDLRAAGEVLETSLPERAASDGYYAMFHAAEALLLSEGLEHSSHAATHAAYGLLFAKTGKLDPKFHRQMLAAYDNRLTADYDVTMRLPLEEVHALIAQAKEFVAAAEQYLNALGSQCAP